jgi:hypothetical protein
VETAASALVPQHRTRAIRNLTEIAIPIYNEEKVLAASIHRLRDHLNVHFPYPFVLTIADNGSTDGSWELATRLAGELPDVRAVQVPAKGRGGAIRHVWSRSEARVVAYMDVDLSIALDAFAPLVAAVMSGHSDLAVGTRYAQASFVDRSPKRAFFSRSYNYLLRNTLGARFSDAMCGFKAARTDVIQALLPAIEDNKWFFDTELLLFAQRRGLRIHEVPVVCIDDPDSSVHVVHDALDDLEGMARVSRRVVHGAQHLALPRNVHQSRLPAPASRPAPWFTGIWAACTVVYTLLYALLRDPLPALGANALALLLATFLNTAALRQFSFGVRGAADAIRPQLDAWVDLVIRLVLSSACIVVLNAAWPDVPAPTELAAVFAVVALSSVIRFLLLREGVADPKPPRGEAA